MKDLGFGIRRPSALSASALLGMAMLALTGCTIIVQTRDVEEKRAEDLDYRGRAQIGLGWHVEPESMRNYRLLSYSEHERLARSIWNAILDSINEDGEDRTNKFRIHYNAPTHQQAHEDRTAVRRWVLANNILPTNPHDIEEDPDGMYYFWEDGVEYCVHEHQILSSPTPFRVSRRASIGDGARRRTVSITARVKLTITWRRDRY